MAKTRRLVHPEGKIHPMVSEAFFALVPIEDRDFKISEPDAEPKTPKCKSKCKKQYSALAEEHFNSKNRTRTKRERDANYNKAIQAKRKQKKELMAEVREELSEIQEVYSNLCRDKARLEEDLKTETDSYEQKMICYTIKQIDIDLCYYEFCMSIARRTPGKNKEKSFSRLNKASNAVALLKLKEYYEEAETLEEVEEYPFVDFDATSEEDLLETKNTHIIPIGALELYWHELL